MKILVTTDNIGGVWTYSLELARGLSRAGIHVVLAVMGEPLTEKQRKELAGLDYYFGAFKQEWMEEPWADIQYAGRWLLEIARVEKPELVHLNSFSFGDLPWEVPVVSVIHSCVLSWWEAVKKEKAPPRYDTYRKMVSKGLHAVDVVIAPSHAMMKAAEKHYGAFQRKKVIYNGRNPSLFKRNRKEKFIFSMGRLWDEAKNVQTLIDMAPEIQCPIYIAGANESIDKSTLPENVILTGQLDQKDVAQYLSAAAIYFLPVKYEPFGYTFLEAAFSGCAIVGSPIQSLTEIWGNHMIYAGLVADKNTSDILNTILEDDALLETFQLRAFRHAHIYTLQKMLDEYRELYEYMLNPQRKLILN